jgi:hypothetical protein
MSSAVLMVMLPMMNRNSLENRQDGIIDDRVVSVLPAPGGMASDGLRFDVPNKSAGSSRMPG